MTPYYTFISRLTYFFTPLSILLFLNTATAQIGGRSTFAFMKNSPSARISGLAQSQIAVQDDDLSLGYTNPALLNPLMHKALTLNNEWRLHTNWFWMSNETRSARLFEECPLWI